MLLPLNDPFSGNTHNLANIQGGNANLNLEKADTFTAGVVLTPSFVPRFRASADFSTMGLRYYMLHGQHQHYIPLGRSYTLALNFMADWGKTYGGKSFPVIKNMYAGGIGTVRGYEGGSLGRSIG